PLPTSSPLVRPARPARPSPAAPRVPPVSDVRSSITQPRAPAVPRVPPTSSICSSAVYPLAPCSLRLPNANASQSTLVTRSSIASLCVAYSVQPRTSWTDAHHSPIGRSPSPSLSPPVP
ncbi:Unknown protein, partial [Striga hermonthica]